MKVDSKVMERDDQTSETAEELIGVLTAISVVTKRMAKKLSAMEHRRAMSRGEKASGEPTGRTGYAD